MPRLEALLSQAGFFSPAPQRRRRDAPLQEIPGLNRSDGRRRAGFDQTQILLAHHARQVTVNGKAEPVAQLPATQNPALVITPSLPNFLEKPR